MLKSATKIALTLSIICLLPICTQGRQIPLETARQVAANFMYSRTKRQVDSAAIRPIFTEKVNQNNIYHVMNLSPEGWVIVAGDDIAHPIIAFSYNGQYSTTQDQPVQFRDWMEVVKLNIRRGLESVTPAIQQISPRWAELSVPLDESTTPLLEYAVMGPLLTTQWNQGTYYNEFCPVDAAGPGGHAWAGCVATAMAQVMKYHNHPATGVGSHSYTPSTNPGYGLQSADFASTTYNWAAMPTPQVSSSNTDVATLLYHAGVSVDMDYANDGSSASTSDAPYALVNYFKYSESAEYLTRTSYTAAEWSTILITEINNDRPVIYRGDGTGGHAFVCDGYNNDSSDDYFHFNWGWSGSYDGYFYLDDLTPGTDDFTYSQAAVVGIQPQQDPALTFPYNQSFEDGFPEEWLSIGERISISSAEAQDGAFSLLIGTVDGTGYSHNNTTFHLNVPEQGAVLSFRVKRGYSPSQSVYNQQTATLLTQFNESTLHTFYDGDFNDLAWQEMTIDLTPWAGTNVKLFIEQNNSSTSFTQWTYVDAVSIVANTLPCDIDGSGQVDLTDVVLGLQTLSGSVTAADIDAGADTDGDGSIGTAEVICALQAAAD